MKTKGASVLLKAASIYDEYLNTVKNSKEFKKVSENCVFVML